jgi:hypothetical protein
MGALSSAPTASATCAAGGGFTVGDGCTATPGSTAVGIGNDATATATGERRANNTALAVGP